MLFKQSLTSSVSWHRNNKQDAAAQNWFVASASNTIKVLFNAKQQVSDTERSGQLTPLSLLLFCKTCHRMHDCSALVSPWILHDISQKATERSLVNQLYLTAPTADQSENPVKVKREDSV